MILSIIALVVAAGSLVVALRALQLARRSARDIRNVRFNRAPAEQRMHDTVSQSVDDEDDHPAARVYSCTHSDCAESKAVGKL